MSKVMVYTKAETHQFLQNEMPWPVWHRDNGNVVARICPLCSAAIPEATWNDYGPSAAQHHTEYHVNMAAGAAS